MGKKRLIFFLLLVVLCILQNGCALLTIPLQLAGSAIGLAANAMSLYSSLGLPPPWLFL